ncbi:MAG: right-handed parallel beta-helix repeat-containing protein [Myxococcales bacterium]|nr:right-handed parallel beta-helix repeat-containing protein [Myxococcales bacterium]
MGWRACPAGFEPDPSGWGCVEVLPTAVCAGAWMERLGSPTCQPIGDCARVFPPAQATLFVDAQYADSQLDATHFRTLGAALAAAPAGATVAVYDGRYFERLKPVQSLKLAGRCAEKVIIQSTGADLSGVRASGPISVEISGVTLIGHRVGAWVDSGGSLTLREVLVGSNRELGIYVTGAGSKAVVEASAIRDTLNPPGASLGQGVNVESGGTLELGDSEIRSNRSLGLYLTDVGSRAEVTGTVIRDTMPDGLNESGIGVLLENGAALVASRTALIANLERGVDVVGGTMDLTDSVVRDTRSNRPDLLSASGINAEGGARLRLSRVSLVSNSTIGLVLRGSGTTATLLDTVVRSTKPGPSGRGAGIELVEGAELSLGGSALVDNPMVGLVLVGSRATVTRSLVLGTVPTQAMPSAAGVSAETSSCVSLADTAVVGNWGLGVLLHELAAGCEAQVTGSLIAHTRPTLDGLRGRGLAAQGARLTMSDSAVVSNRGIGLMVSRPSSRLVLERSAVRGTVPELPQRFGHAVVAFPDTFVKLLDTDLEASAGVGLAVSGASAAVVAGAISGNSVAVHVQDGSELQVADMVPEQPGPREVVISEGTRFIDNLARTGTGVIPLPEPVGPLKQ